MFAPIHVTVSDDDWSKSPRKMIGWKAFSTSQKGGPLFDRLLFESIEESKSLSNNTFHLKFYLLFWMGGFRPLSVGVKVGAGVKWNDSRGRVEGGTLFVQVSIHCFIIYKMISLNSIIFFPYIDSKWWARDGSGSQPSGDTWSYSRQRTRGKFLISRCFLWLI